MSGRTIRFVTVKNGDFIEEVVTVSANASNLEIESEFSNWLSVTNGTFWQDVHICEKCGRRLERQVYMRRTEWERTIQNHKCNCKEVE